MKWLRKFFRGPLLPAVFSAILGPGTGQILNGDFKKGLLLMVTAFGSFLWFSKVVGERLSLVLAGTPEDWKLDPVKLTDAFTNLVHESPGMFLSFQVLMLLLWIYSTVDAYSVAKERRKPRPIVSEPL
jgi:hypothetical protein